MPRYKGRYVAQIVIDIDYDDEQSLKGPYDGIEYDSFEIVKGRLCGGEMTEAIDSLLRDEIVSDEMTLTVTQQYADLYKVEETE